MKAPCNEPISASPWNAVNARMTEPALRAHPIAELVPSMTPDQYGALVYDIREHGLRTPIVMYEGKVLDGRHRLRALVQHQTAASQAIADRLLRGSGGGILEPPARPPKKELPHFPDAEANCQGGWRRYRDHRARRQGSKSRT